MAVKAARRKKQKIVMKKNLRDFMKDESGYMTKENLLKVAVGTMTGFGVLMASSQAQAQHQQGPPQGPSLLDLYNSMTPAERAALASAMGVGTQSDDPGPGQVAGIPGGWNQHINAESLEWRPTGVGTTLEIFPSHTHHSVHVAY
jgi:hypothetical protein